MNVDKNVRAQDATEEDDEIRGFHDTSPDVAAESVSAPNDHEIAKLAYALWQERGCPEGCPEEDWYRAEKKLLNNRS